MKKLLDLDIFNKYKKGYKSWKIKNDVGIVVNIHFVKQLKELVIIAKNG